MLIVNKFEDLNYILLQVDFVDHENHDFIDPLRAPATNEVVSIEGVQDGESSFTVPSKAATEAFVKEWTSFKRFLMQKFPVSKMVSISSVSTYCLFFHYYES